MEVEANLARKDKVTELSSRSTVRSLDQSGINYAYQSRWRLNILPDPPGLEYVGRRPTDGTNQAARCCVSDMNGEGYAGTCMQPTVDAIRRRAHGPLLWLRITSSRHQAALWTDARVHQHRKHELFTNVLN